MRAAARAPRASRLTRGHSVDLFRERYTSDSLVCYARLWASAHIKANADQFAPFVSALHPGVDLARFCTAEVEGMGKECDEVQVIATTQALGTPVRLLYIDGSPGDEPAQHVRPDDSAEPLATLLYRPGHYDVLYAGAGGK